jgi:hypothetical protein
MRERAGAKIDEILGQEPEHIPPLEIEERIRDIARRAAADQTEIGWESVRTLRLGCPTTQTECALKPFGTTATNERKGAV